MIPDCFVDQTINYVQSTHEIYDGCLAPVKRETAFVIEILFGSLTNGSFPRISHPSNRHD